MNIIKINEEFFLILSLYTTTQSDTDYSELGELLRRTNRLLLPLKRDRNDIYYKKVSADSVLIAFAGMTTAGYSASLFELSSRIFFQMQYC